MPGAELILKNLEGAPLLQIVFAGLFGLAGLFVMVRALQDKRALPAAPAVPDVDDRRIEDELHRITLRVERVEEGQANLRRSLDSHHDTIERRMGDLQATADRIDRNAHAALEVLTRGRVLEFPNGRNGSGL
jgi:hypothetical protein